MKSFLENKNILLLAHSFPKDDIDFRGRFIFDFISETKANEIFVIAPHIEKTFVLKKENVTIFYFKWSHGFLATYRLFNPVHLFFTGLMVLFFLFYSIKLLKLKKIDHIFCAWAFPAGFIGRILSFFSKTPYSVWLLGSDVNKFLSMPFLLSFVFQKAENIFANSVELKNKVQHLTKKEILILPTFSKLPKPSKPKNPVVFGETKLNVAFVGRLEKIKGIETFLEIAKSVKEKSLNVDFYIFGSGSFLKRSKEFEKKGIVFNFGEISPEELSFYAKNIHLLLIVSESESMPVVFWEFKDFTTILSFPVGDIPLYIDKNCLMKTKEEFIDKILEFEKKRGKKC